MSTFKTRSEAAKRGAVTKKRKKFLTAWLEALCSGEYKQANGQLCEVTVETKGKNAGKEVARHCCLGVACEVASRLKLIPITVDNSDAEEQKQNAEKYGYNEYIYTRGFDGETKLLTGELAEAFGLASIDGSFMDENGDSENLANLNDSGYSFKRIAKIIESKPEGLFRN